MDINGIMAITGAVVNTATALTRTMGATSGEELLNATQQAMDRARADTFLLSNSMVGRKIPGEEDVFTPNFRQPNRNQVPPFNVQPTPTPHTPGTGLVPVDVTYGRIPDGYIGRRHDIIDAGVSYREL